MLEGGREEFVLGERGGGQGAKGGGCVKVGDVKVVGPFQVIW